MERIKILHVVRPAEGGMKEHLVSLAKNTDQNKFKVMVACPEGSSTYDELVKAGIEVFPFSIVGQLNPKRDWRSIRQLITIMKKVRPHIVHTHSSKAGLVGRIAAKMTGVPIVFMTAHNSIFYDNLSLKKKLLFAYTEKMLALGTDKIIAVSEALKDEILTWEKINPAKITVIKNGIDVEKFQISVDKIKICQELDLKPDLPIVGTVARFAPQKGLTYLIDAIAMINNTDAQFLIIGDGPLREDLEKQVQKLGLTNKIFFAGLRRDIDHLLPVMDIFVLPSVTEGLPLTILEAMAAARPIVATAVGGIPEVIIDKKTGLLIPSKDADKLAQAIKQLLEDNTLARTLANNGFALVDKEFNLNLMVKNTTDMYLQYLSLKEKQIAT